MHRMGIFFFGWILMMTLTAADLHYKKEPLVHTYSIVARDPQTGQMGVAVQSHWFSVGSVVSWAEAGVGAVATQSFVNPAFGQEGLKLLKEGRSAAEALSIMIEGDEGRDYRQLAVIDARGRTATHTGKKCIPAAGHFQGESFSVQANMMLNEKVWPAMAQAFTSSQGPLAERMLAALEAGERAGGDIRGKQSAAILVVRGNPTGKIWLDREIDLRVEDHEKPLEEIKRILRLYRAYEHMNNGDVAVEKNDMDGALREYGAAEAMFPNNLEMKYWHAIALANKKRLEEALPLFKAIFQKDPNWRTLTERLPGVGLLLLSPEELRKLLSQ